MIVMMMTMIMIMTMSIMIIMISQLKSPCYRCIRFPRVLRRARGEPGQRNDQCQLVGGTGLPRDGVPAHEALGQQGPFGGLGGLWGFMGNIQASLGILSCSQST